MKRAIAVLVVLAAIVAFAAKADARRARVLKGSYSNAFTGVQKPIKLKGGKLDSGTGHLVGKLVCAKKCPLRGKLDLDCALPGDQGHCTGPLTRKDGSTCTVDSYLTGGTSFQGQYNCADGTVGAVGVGAV